MSTDKPAASAAPPQDEAAGRAPLPAEVDTQPPAAGPRPGEAAVPALQPELEAARAAATENLDKFLRAKAETENVRRRAENDVANAHKYAIERFALEMLAVRDSLERARGVETQAPEAVGEKVLEGLDLTLKLMDSAFQKFGLTMIDPQKGERFDPERHQAMSTQESNELAPNLVLATVQKGCLLNNRLLRPALVIVTRTAAAGAANPPAA